MENHQDDTDTNLINNTNYDIKFYLKKEKVLIEQMDRAEKNYLNNLINKLGKKFIENKIELINKLITRIDQIHLKMQNNLLSAEIYEDIKKIAISKGGFLLNTYRKEFYKAAFNLNSEDIIFYIYSEGVFEKNKICSVKEFYKMLMLKNTNTTENTNRDHYIIEVDVKRTVANHFFDRNINDEELDMFKERLTNFIKLFFSFNPHFHYYQGFHDIALYFYLVFYNYEHLAIQMLQRVSEYFLKDYMVEIFPSVSIENTPGRKPRLSDKQFKFETVFSVLNKTISLNNKNIAEFLSNNTNISDPIFSLPWVITMYTHDVCNLFLELRLFDYFLFSHPHAIYQMTSHVIEIYLIFRLLSIKWKN
jgi:hypothetical protein